MARGLRISVPLEQTHNLLPDRCKQRGLWRLQIDMAPPGTGFTTKQILDVVMVGAMDQL